MSKVTIKGVYILIAAQKKAASTEKIALYPKSSHDVMATDNTNNLFERAVSNSQNKYDLFYLNINYAIESKHSNHVRYSLHDVFTISKQHQY